MATKHATTRQRAAAAPRPAVKRRLFTVDEYDRMIEAGILFSGERVELLGGEILHMAAIGADHSWCVTRLTNWFARRLPETLLVRMQDPIHLPPDSEPEPDLTIVPAPARVPHPPLPGPGDVLLLIEVADSSLRADREKKLRRYAAAGIPETWLVDLPGECIHRYREPKDGAYIRITTFRRGDMLTPLAFPDLTLAVDDILGPAADPA